MISNLVKEVYEKGKVKSMLPDNKKAPPFVKKGAGNKPQDDAMAKAKQNAVQSRLAKMKAANSKGK